MSARAKKTAARSSSKSRTAAKSKSRTAAKNKHPLGLQVELLEDSFNAVAPQGDALVARFYEELFARYPAVKPLFSNTTIQQQEKKLLASLKLVIANLRNVDVLADALTKLGKRHQEYGAEPAHYEAVASTLLDVMAEFAGKAWTKEVHAAWSQALGVIGETMLNAYSEVEDTKMAASASKITMEQQNELVRMNSAVKNAMTAIMMIDRDLNITFANDTTFRLLRKHEETLRSVYPSFSVDTLVGTCIDVFHANPAHQRQLLSDPKNLPYSTDIKVGPLSFNINVSSMIDGNGKYIGCTLEWSEVTEVREKESQIVRLQSTVDGAMTAIMMIDRDLNITYANDTTLKLLGKHEQTLRTIYPGFSVDKIIGTCIDTFHANPEHQRRLLSDPKNLPYSADINVGPLVFNINVNAIMDVDGSYVGNSLEWSEVTDLRKREGDVVRLQGTVDGAMTAIMMIDRDLNITYANDSTFKLLRKHEGTLRTIYPGFSVDGLIGTCIDTFHANPAHQRQLLGNPANLPYSTDIQVGPLTFRINVTAIMDIDGNYVGCSLEWADVTETRKKEAEVARLQTAIDGAETNLMLCDEDLNITYANPSVVRMLSKRLTELRTIWPSLDPNNLVGVCIDVFHKNPEHQRALLKDVSRLPARADIKVGSLEFTVNATAILDHEGNYTGNMVEWQDITEQMAAEREIQGLIDAAIEGVLDKRIDANAYEGFLQGLGTGINDLMDNIVTPLQETKRVMAALAQGDLTNSMQGDFKGDFAELRDSVNGSIDNLYRLVTEISASANDISSGAGQISQGNTDLSQRTQEQASSLEEVASSMEEMTSTVNQNADNAQQANQLASAARDQADTGGEVVGKAVTAMNAINESSKQIADIISVIDEIAFQTNLLALNAAVEAARAGEQGRGFAVVASEVRNLAGRSAKAAKEIKSLIKDSVEKVDDGTRLVDESGKTLEEIVTSVKKVSDIVAEIAAASQEQSDGIGQVNKAIMEMDDMTQQNASLVEEAAAASENMGSQAQELNVLMESFILNEDSQASLIQQRRRNGGDGGHARLSAPAVKAPPIQRAKPTTALPQKRDGGEAKDDGDWQEF